MRELKKSDESDASRPSAMETDVADVAPGTDNLVVLFLHVLINIQTMTTCLVGSLLKAPNQPPKASQLGLKLCI